MEEERDWAFELASVRAGDDAREDAWLIARGAVSSKYVHSTTTAEVWRKAKEYRAIGAAHIFIGLFGTCGGSHWRDAFIQRFTDEGIRFFNPQVVDWVPACAIEEARHLVDDQIILFPVTDETYGSGSLAEIGFAALQVVRSGSERYLVIMIASDLDPKLDNLIARKESLRARALVIEHLQRLNLPRVHVVISLEEMLELSSRLHKAAMPRAYFRALIAGRTETNRKDIESTNQGEHQWPDV